MSGSSVGGAALPAGSQPECRLAWDDHLWTLNDFVNWYGECGHEQWYDAPTYNIFRDWFEKDADLYWQAYMRAKGKHPGG